MPDLIDLGLSTPIVKEMRVVPVAGQDSMLLNLSGAHGPYFTRNIVILKDTVGNVGVSEVPGGEKIRSTLDEAASIVVGSSIGRYRSVAGFRIVMPVAADRKPLISGSRFTRRQPLKRRCWISLESSWKSRWLNYWAMGSNAMP